MSKLIKNIKLNLKITFKIWKINAKSTVKINKKKYNKWMNKSAHILVKYTRITLLKSFLRFQ
jgi:hypothetical protein